MLDDDLDDQDMNIKVNFKQWFKRKSWSINKINAFKKEKRKTKTSIKFYSDIIL